jgi:hypothetical protein
VRSFIVGDDAVEVEENRANHGALYPTASRGNKRRDLVRFAGLEYSRAGTRRSTACLRASIPVSARYD